MIRDTPHGLHRPLSDIGLVTSPLGLGTIKLGHNQEVKYPSGFTTPGDRKAVDLLTLTRDLGINLINTAPAYGRSEERLGPLLRGQHEHWVIVSRVGGEFVDGQLVLGFSATHTWRSVECSPKRLEAERIELVLVHFDGNDLDILESSEVYPTFAVLKRRGLISAYGFFGKVVEGGLRVLREGDCAMVTHNLDKHAECPIIEYVVTHVRDVLVKEALASGHAYLDAGQDPVRVSFELVFDQPNVATAIVSTINPSHLAHNVAMAA